MNWLYATASIIVLVAAAGWILKRIPMAVRFLILTPELVKVTVMLIQLHGAERKFLEMMDKAQPQAKLLWESSGLQTFRDASDKSIFGNHAAHEDMVKYSFESFVLYCMVKPTYERYQSRLQALRERKRPVPISREFIFQRRAIVLMRITLRTHGFDADELEKQYTPA